LYFYTSFAPYTGSHDNTQTHTHPHAYPLCYYYNNTMRIALLMQQLQCYRADNLHFFHYTHLSSDDDSRIPPCVYLLSHPLPIQPPPPNPYDLCAHIKPRNPRVCICTGPTAMTTHYMVPFTKKIGPSTTSAAAGAANSFRVRGGDRK